MKAYFYLIFTACVVIVSCSDIPSREEAGEFIQITDFSISPDAFAFNIDDGVGDTSVIANLNIRFNVLSDTGESPAKLGYIIRDATTDLTLFEGEHAVDFSTNTAQIEIPLTLRTFDSRELGLTSFFISDGRLLSNVATGSIRVRGFSVGLPEVVSVENPDTVRIPAANQPNVGFSLKARVIHPVDQALINRVLVDIRDQGNNLLAGSPFQMFDDGNLATLPTGSTSGDEVAGDSLYTRLFQISSANNPDVYTMFYHAIDNFGASSDTVQSTMRFIR
ncbi:MAG: hypothetical protein JJU41_02750 [Bacteroidetes bacterium]|nr:hypothetical protein [Bacteroidota bacterium]MCH8523543.1 hypothetical protein [Balneolales bacterium]